MEQVLIIEDDSGIRDFVHSELEHEGFIVTEAADGRAGLTAFEEVHPDIIILDIMLPELSGLEVLRRIRKQYTVPVILLTARGETYDKVNGLNAGADDYLAKPFEIEELLARMRAVMRRSVTVGNAGDLRVRELVISPESMEAQLNGQSIELSRTEFLMLKLLVERKNRVLSRDEIISAVWGKEHYIEENAVDVYIGYLRAKIDRPACQEYISTVRGAGYVMRDSHGAD
jgi:two-component system, OmpR family, response regulator ArlR